MFSTENLYNLFKPKDKEDLITNYQIVIGGTVLPADLENGCIILNPILSEVVTNQYKDLQNLITPLIEPLDYAFINESSIIKLTYQVDVYKVNAPSLMYIEAEREAIKLREWLKSFETIEYLESLNSQILPCYSPISFSSELYNKKFANRATFDFEIITLTNIQEKTAVADKIIIENQIILQGEKTNG